MTLNNMVGKKCIVRTHSDGVWFGEIGEKFGDEVIIFNARRMYYWWASQGISLSAVALYGINQEKSKIVEPCAQHWTKAIGITLCTDVAIKSIEEAPHVHAR
jgi:hypothetical protein